MRCSNTFVPLVLLLATLTFSAHSTNRSSDNQNTQDLNATVTGSTATYLELVRKVLTDAQTVPNEVHIAIAHNTVPFRHLSDSSDSTPLEGDIKLVSFESRWIRTQGRRILLMKLDLMADVANQGTNYEGEATVLAAFSLQPSPRLLDAIDIKTDRFTGYWEKPSVFQLNARNDAFLVYSSHWNAGENYGDLTLVFMNRNRFERITNIFLYDTQGCGATFTETPAFRTLAGKAQTYPNVQVTVKVEKSADSSDCDHPTGGYVKMYQAIYHWNVAKGEYQTTSRQLEALASFNQNRL